jgi:long-chain acyl-CoA synthetase
MMNLYDLFRATAERQPSHPAIIGPAAGFRVSYAELRNRIDALAQRLERLGVGPGHCIAVHHPSGPEYVVLTYAAWRLGACAVPLAVELRPDERDRVLQEIHVDYVLGQPRHVRGIEAGDAADVAEVSSSLLCKRVRRDPPPPALTALDPAFLRFTSGTTATAKGVVLSHRTVFERIQAANEVLRIGPADRVVFLLSMSYHFTVSVVCYLTYGATVVLCPSGFGKTILQAVDEHAGTFIYGSPMHYDMMSAIAGEQRLASVRLAISTTTGLRRDSAEAFYRRFGLPLSQAYGIIEIGLPCINLHCPLEKFDSVGQVLPAYEVRLGEPPEGMPDQRPIAFRGPGFVDAYYEPWRTREQIMPGGWLATGDLGSLDDQGYLYIRGRSKDMISVSGMKFFAQEVEAVLRSHPAVRDACVYPHPHERLGEVPWADVVTDPGVDRAALEANIKEYCGARLVEFMVPERVRFVEALARTASGKVVRREIMAA